MSDLIGRIVREDNVDETDGLAIYYTVDKVKSGWTTLRTADGVERKVRGDIEAEDDLTLMPEGFEPEDDDEAEGGSKMASQLTKYRETYVPAIAASGRKSLSNGDPVALALEHYPIDALYATVQDLFDLDEKDIDLRVQYARLNIGAQRMNLGNRIRAAYKKESHKKHAAVVEWVQARVEVAKQETDND